MNYRKSVTVFLFKDFIIIVPKKKAISGLEFVSNPVARFDIHENVSTLGSTILEFLDKFIVEEPDLKKGEYKTIFEPILDSVNCKSYNAFWKSVKYVPVSLENGTITLYATENFGPKGGYSGKVMPKIEFKIESVTNEDLGRALLKAFELSSIVGQEKPNV